MLPTTGRCTAQPHPPKPDPDPVPQLVKVWYVEVPCGCVDDNKIVDIVKSLVNKK